jgi:hypothetical protein
MRERVTNFAIVGEYVLIESDVGGKGCRNEC